VLGFSCVWWRERQQNMAVYVDPLLRTTPYHESVNKRWNWRQSCHLVADTEEELHAFAAKIGLQRAWFQQKSSPHYDLTANKRNQAVRLGAISLTREQMGGRIINRNTMLKGNERHTLPTPNTSKSE
jgi:hypothetical protein